MTHRLITFYSFKGGVGRSTVLATVAWILASSGRKVLAIDWDLDAPGLHYFFPRVEETSGTVQQPGLLDLVGKFIRRHERIRPGDSHREPIDEATEAAIRAAVKVVLNDLPAHVIKDTGASFGDGGDGGCVHLMHAGHRRDRERYGRALVDLDWSRLFVWRGIGDNPSSPFLDEFKRRLFDDFGYEYVLVDSRTGMGGMAAVTMFTLADHVVNCFGMSRQSIEGAWEVASDVRAKEKTVFPVPTRLDGGSGDRLYAGQQVYQRKLNQLLEAQAAESASGFRIGRGLGTYWREVEVPYDTFWALEEMPAPVAGPDDRVIRACVNLARYLTAADDQPVTDLRWPDEVFADEVLPRAKRTAAPTFYTVVVTFVPEDRNWAYWLADRVRRVGFRVILHEATSVPTERIGGRGSGRPNGPDGVLDKAKEDSGGAFCVVPVISEKYSPGLDDALLINVAGLRLTPEHDVVLRPVVVSESASGIPGARLWGLVEYVAASVLTGLLGAPVDPDPSDELSKVDGVPVRFPGFSPSDPEEVARQRLWHARHRQNPDEVIAQHLTLGGLALKSHRTKPAHDHFDSALARADAELAQISHARPTGADSGVLPVAEQRFSRLRLFKARALLGLSEIRMLSGDDLNAREFLEQIRELTDPAHAGPGIVVEVWKVRSRALRFRADLAMLPSETPGKRYEVGRRMWEVLGDLGEAGLRSELALVHLTLARLIWSVDPDSSEMDRLKAALASANEARRIFGDLDENDGRARSELEIGRLKTRQAARQSGVPKGVLRHFRDAEKFMDLAGRDQFDIVLGHDILTQQGLYENEWADAVNAHTRALALVQNRAAADHIRGLLAVSHFHLGNLYGGDAPGTEAAASEVAERDGGRALGHFVTAVSLWTDDMPIGIVTEYADAFLQISGLIYESKIPSEVLARTSFLQGRETAAMATVRAAWTWHKVGGEESRASLEALAAWVAAKPATWKARVSELVSLGSGSFMDADDKKEVLKALGLERRPRRR